MIAVAMADSTADLVGGRILPIWSSPPPKWLADDPELRVWLALMEYGRPAVLRSATEDDSRIWTANMAVKRSVIRALGGFDTRRGPVGDRLRRDEDADLVGRALGAGYRAVYDPRLVVRHHVTPDRLCRGYFRRFSRQVAEGRAELEVWPACRSLWGASFYSYQYAASRMLRWLMVLLAGRRGAFRAELEFQAALGRLRGRWKAYGRRYRRESQS
jgi:GT2 family glycosyltransferase